jgi:hypothetical protein
MDVLQDCSSFIMAKGNNAQKKEKKKAKKEKAK